MGNAVKEKPIPIQTTKVFTKDETVFTKDDNENWLPIHFSWVPIQTA